MNGNQFIAATWNAAGGTDNPPTPDTYKRVVNNLYSGGVSVLAIQETDNHKLLDIVRDGGFSHIYFGKQQNALAFTNRWFFLDRAQVDLAPHNLYNRVGGQKDVHTMGCWALVADNSSPNALAVMSYHLPASVQVSNKPDNRIAATREAAGTWKKLVSPKGRFGEDADAFLFMGDDNIDERLNHGPWRFMFRAHTGLRQIQAPAGTHGSRKIDDMRIRGLKPGHGRVLPGGGDHRIHVRHFSWK